MDCSDPYTQPPSFVMSSSVTNKSLDSLTLSAVSINGPSSTASSTHSNYTTQHSNQDYFSIKPKLKVSISNEISSTRSSEIIPGNPLLFSPLDCTNSEMDEEDDFEDDEDDENLGLINPLHHKSSHGQILDYSPLTPFTEPPSASLSKPSFTSHSPVSENIDINLVIRRKSANPATYNFLIVDDNIINIKILERILFKLYPNCNIKKLQDPTKVANAIKTHKFDVVFLDIEMPEITGVDISREMRQQPVFNLVGIIAVTTRTMAHDLLVYETVGIDYTFAKPLTYNYDFVMDRIDEVIRNRILT